MRASRGSRLAMLLAVWLAAFAVHAAEVAGIKVDDKVQVGGQELVLNGAGLRTRFFIKVYVGALYVDQKTTAPATIYDSAAPRRMTLRMLREMGADALYGALDEGLRNNLTSVEMAELKPQAEQLGAIMKSIGTVKEGDSITIDFGAAGIEVGLNGKPRGKVDGAAFGKALLRVWLGEQPADASLKKALLGG
ncbi:MAG: chalcone isomerase family protein [Pseudomonadota bacterium]|jgi:long-chain acyl-CoA synthetase